MKNKKKVKYKLRVLYNYIFKDALPYGVNFNMQMVAATYMAIGIRLYKTHLTDKEYKLMMEAVMEIEVKPYKNSKNRLH